LKERMERLHKFLARCGVCSRRKAEELILEGKVKVNKNVVKKLGVKIDPDKDIVEVEGRIIRPSDFVYIMLNKPAGYITSLKDEWGRPTVLELIKGIKQRVFPVGRLDLDSEGLLLLTNDGELAFRLTHPRYHVKKRYVVRAKGILTSKDLRSLKEGVELEDGKALPAEVRVLKLEKETTLLEISLKEGRKRQIKRMFKAVGHPVLYLKRIAFGPLTLGDLPKGTFRMLTSEEVKMLYEIVGLS